MLEVQSRVEVDGVGKIDNKPPTCIQGEDAALRIPCGTDGDCARI